MSPHRKIDPDTSQILILLMTRLVGTYAIINGLGIIIGGRRRWEGNPALEAALSFPAAPASWGFVALSLGVLTMVGTFTRSSLAMYGCWGIAMWAAFFAFTLTVSAFASPAAATTGPPTYTLVALISIALAIPWRKGA